MNRALGTLITCGNIYIANIFIYITEQQSSISNSIFTKAYNKNLKQIMARVISKSS